MLAIRQLNRILPVAGATLLLLIGAECRAVAQLQIRDVQQPNEPSRASYYRQNVNPNQNRFSRSAPVAQQRNFGQRSTAARTFTPATRASFPRRQVTQSTAILPPDANVQQSTTLTARQQ